MSEPASNVVPLHTRLPPQNLDAERSLLGGLLLDGAKIDDVLLHVRGADFYRGAHRKIFEAMVDLSLRNEPIDRVQVKSSLTRLGILEEAGGEDYLDELDKVPPISANLEHYAKIIANAGLLRNVIETTADIARHAYEQQGDVQDFVDEAEARFFELRSRRVAGEFKIVGELVPGVWAEIERRSQHDSVLVGAPSGLERLDEMTNGFKNGNLVIIAARSGMGKSALAADIARAVAEAGGAAAFFSLEMSKEELTVRLLASIARVNSKHIETGKLKPEEWGRLEHARKQLPTLPIHLFAKEEVRASEIRAHSRRLAAKLANTSSPLRVVVVDYLQLMYCDEDAERREREIAKNTRQMKGLATQLQVPVLLLSQLNREVEKRPDKRPRPSDLRESGAVEQDADLILFVYREEFYKPSKENAGVAEIIVAKQRNGPVGFAKVAFEKEYSSFRDLYELPPEPEQQKLEMPQREEPPHPAEDP